ncbi:MAG: DUF2807 domain-containing protein [Bacteroidota bacterium]
MQHLRFFCLFFLTCFLGQLQAQIQGNGQIENQTRSSELFTELYVDFPARVEVTCQQLPYIELSADGNLLDYIATETHGNSLRIKTTAGIQPTEMVSIKIGTAFLQRLETATAGGQYMVKNIETSEFRLINLTADVSLEGQTEELRLSIENGQANATELIAQKVYVDIWGVGKAQVTAKNLVHGTIARDATFTYQGEPSKVRLNKSKTRSYVAKEGKQPAPKPAPAPSTQGKEVPYLTIKLKNNSDKKIETVVRGPSGRSFSYGLPFRPGQVRHEEFPVGTKVYLVRSFLFNKLLVEVKQNDEQKTLSLFN